MPVYDRRYRAYDGPRTPERRRFLVLPRYALAEVFASRLTTIAFVLACLPALGFMVVIYLANNLDALALLGARAGANFVAIDGAFFFYFLVTQLFCGFLLTALVGPALIAPDLAHDALPLYLSRPLTRGEYVLGKFLVLALLLSAVTWVPGELLFLLQAALAEPGWTGAHLQLAWSLFAGAWLWILVVALLALAVSAWVRFRPVATAAIIGFFLVGAGLGNAINTILDTKWGTLLILDDLVERLWAALFDREPAEHALSVSASLVGIAVFCLLSLALLHKKVRAREVSR